MKAPTTYLSPEECEMGEGLRILSDPHFDLAVWQEPEPLALMELAEIEAALAQRAMQLREHQERAS